MREWKVYYAFDDKEFFDRDECERYEWQAIECMTAVNECYDFFDKSGNRFMPPPYDSAEDWMNWICDAAEHCDSIRVNHLLPKLADDFVLNKCGYYITSEDFNNETGLFKYDYLKDEWVKVGE